MKIIHTRAIGTGYIAGKTEEGECLVEFLHNDYYFEISEEALQPFMVHNTLYEVILRRKGEWK